MNFVALTNVLSLVALICGGTLLSSALVSFLMQDPSAVALFFLSYSLLIIFVSILIFFKTKSIGQLGLREGFLIVTSGWIMIALLGAVPFCWLSGFKWVDAIFEAMSGFTTTGASVIDSSLVLSDGSLLTGGLPSLPKGLLYWRSMTHWLGGMGVVVLSIAIMPYLGVSGKKLYKAEVSSADSSQLTPRIADVAKILWTVYIVLSIIETILLCIGGMSLFDAWCHTCATIATGGFSTRPESISAFNNVFIESVIMLFMFIGSCNFILHYQAFKRGFSVYWKDEEFRSHLITTAVCGALIAFFIFGTNFKDAAGRPVLSGLFNSVRYSFFQVISMKATTGFCTADFDGWPDFTKFILVILMIVGGCGGSTSGAVKHSRFILLFKYGVMETKKAIFPHSLSNVSLNKNRVDSETLHKVLTFFFVYVAVFTIGALLLCTQNGNDIITSITAAITCIGGVGPGLAKVGAVYTYSWMTPFSKLILTILMLLGRLEIFTVLVIFLPTFWKR
jgi:trk system potassium uptake protein TrkH